MQLVKFLFEPLHQLRRRVCRRQLANPIKQGMQGDWQDPAEGVLAEGSIRLSHRAKDALPVEQRWVCSECACRRQRAKSYGISLPNSPEVVLHELERMALRLRGRLVPCVHVDILLAFEGGAEGA